MRYRSLPTFRHGWYMSETTQEKWLPVDCHAHTTMSDGDLTIGEVVERAAFHNVRPSVSDHVSRSMTRSVTSVTALGSYLDALERQPVLRGAEFCWHDSLWREIPEELSRRFTHRLGSLHVIVLDNSAHVHAGAPRVPRGLTIGAYMTAYIENAERAVREMPVDILAHPTILTRKLHAIEPEALWTEEREERIVQALFRAGIAFEISARYPPHARIVERAIDRGVRLSLASDGHTAAEVADVSRPLALARSLGARDDDLYDPRRHGSKSLH